MPQRPKVHRPTQTTPRPKPDGRLSACKRGYGRAWQAKRLAFLTENPMCVACRARGVMTPATEADHVTPHRGDMEAFWEGELQALCKSCHSTKTTTEGGA